MDVQERYRQKRTLADEAVKLVRPGDWVDYGFATGHPVALDRALARRMAAEPELTGLNFRGSITMWQPEVTKLPDAAERLTWNSWHCSGVDRALIEAGVGYYTPLRYSELPRLYRENIRRVDVAMFQTAPMDRHGFFNFGPNTSHLAALCQVADKVVVEVNRNMPVCLGGHETGVHIDQVDWVVEGDDPPMACLPAPVPGPVDLAVAGLVVPEIRDGACLQLGIGGMPSAVGSLICQSDLKDLGVHTEMYVDAFLDMAEAGKITCARKASDRGRQVYAFAIGSQRLYEYLDGNPAAMAAPVDYVNDIGRISAIDDFVSINSAVNVDLFGQVASETAGLRQISGAGGQLDFVMGAYLSRGGKSFICLPSTITGRDGVVRSRIVPTLPTGAVVTATRANLQYLVTEYGMVNLKGAAAWQRAEAIISVAHPDFREELTAQAEKMKIWRRSNRR